MTEQRFVDYPYYFCEGISKSQKHITEMINSGWRIKISYPYVPQTECNHIIVIYEKETS